MSNRYIYEGIEFKKIPASKATDPGRDALSEAVRIREAREEAKPLGQSRLDSLGEELYLRGRSYIYQAFECGRILCEAKDLLAHGEFKPWVAKHFKHSHKTATTCMRVYRVCLGQPELVEYFDAGCLYIIVRSKFPAPLREALFRNVKGPVKMQKAKLVAVAMKYRNGEIGLDDASVQELLKDQRELDLKDLYLTQLRALRSLVRDRRDRIAELVARDSAQPLMQNREVFPAEWRETIDQMILDFQADLKYHIRQLEHGVEKGEIVA